MKGRISCEGNVISCLYSDPLLLSETELKTTDFITSDGVFYYSLAKELRGKGYTVFDEVAILSSISENIQNAFNERGGYEVIQNLKDVVNIKNWEVYVDQLYRENIILGMFNSGFNLLSPIEENGKEIIPLKLFRKMDSQSVLDWYEVRLSMFGTGYTSQVLEEEEIDFDDTFLQSLDDGTERGVPFDFAGDDINLEEMRCLPFLSNQIDGLLDGTFSILGGYSSVGKSTMWITICMALAYRGRKILIISNEQKAKVFKLGFLTWILYKYFRNMTLTKGKLKSGELSEEEREYKKKAQKYWRDHYKGKIKFIAIPDADMNLVKKKIRQNVLQYGYDTVLYDTLKADFTDDNVDKNVWVSLIKDSRTLDKLAKKYNIIMLASLQLAMNTKGKLFLDASVLSMSKQIVEILENLLLMRSVYQDELDKDNKLYCRPFQRQKIDDKWCEVDYEVDPTAVYKMLFVDKGRNGANSGDTGIAYLLRFNGAMGIFREVAMCRPRHGIIQ